MTTPINPSHISNPFTPKSLLENCGEFFSNFLQEKEDSPNKKESTCQQLKIVCLWQDCEFELDAPNNWENYQIFENHVVSHHDQSLSRSNTVFIDNKRPILFQCVWFGCNWELEDFHSPSDSEYLIKKHLSEHAHHSRLISIGGAYAVYFALPVCKVTERFIPEFPQIFTCQWRHCPNYLDRFTCPLLFYAHVISHAEWVAPIDKWDKNEVGCGWLDCDAMYNNYAKLRVHIRTHTGEKRIACYICGCCFVSTTKYRHHLYRQHQPDDSNIFCEICNRSFHNEQIFIEHMALHVRPFKCSLCDFSSGTRSNLKKHCLFKHSDSRPFSCNMCNKCYKSSSDLNNHIKTHFPENKIEKPISTSVVRRYACHICEKKFSRGYLVTRHLIEKHNHQKQLSTSYIYEKKEDGYLYLKDEFRSS